MCILFAYVPRDPEASGYQLILANNRDEFYARPTLPAELWGEHCISGRDQEPGREGGTWFGLSTKGRVGILLNILSSTSPDPEKKGRGHLVTEFLTNSSLDASGFVAPLAEARTDYNGYNLVLLERPPTSNAPWTACYFSNLDDASPRPITDEIFALSNSILDQPWQKVVAGKREFSTIVSELRPREELTERLIQLLNSEQSHLPDAALQRQAAEVGLPSRLVAQRACIHVRAPQIAYGTRTNTVVVVDRHGNGVYTERTMRQPITADGENTWDVKEVSFMVQ